MLDEINCIHLADFTCEMPCTFGWLSADELFDDGERRHHSFSKCMLISRAPAIMAERQTYRTPIDVLLEERLNQARIHMLEWYCVPPTVAVSLELACGMKLLPLLMFSQVRGCPISDLLPSLSINRLTVSQ